MPPHPTLSTARFFRALLALALVALPACSEAGASAEQAGGAATVANDPVTNGGGGAGILAPVGDGPVVAFLGDSITAGLHLSAEESFPALLAAQFAEEGRPFRRVDGGVSGDTSAGGLRRVDWLLKQSPDILVVELGGNDALRGQSLEAIESNLRAIVQKGEAAGARVLLLGMVIPPNYGPDYTRGFRELYANIAEDEDIAFIPFFMEGVGGDPELMLPDGLHPSRRGHEVLADSVRPALEELLDELPAP